MFATLLLAASIVIEGGAGTYEFDPPTGEWQAEKADAGQVLHGPGDLTIRAAPAIARGGKKVEDLLSAFMTQSGAKLTHAPRVESANGVESAIGTAFKEGDFRAFVVIANKETAAQLVAATKDKKKLSTMSQALTQVMSSVRAIAPKPPQKDAKADKAEKADKGEKADKADKGVGAQNAPTPPSAGKP